MFLAIFKSTLVLGTLLLSESPVDVVVMVSRPESSRLDNERLLFSFFSLSHSLSVSLSKLDTSLSLGECPCSLVVGPSLRGLRGRPCSLAPSSFRGGSRGGFSRELMVRGGRLRSDDDEEPCKVWEESLSGDCMDGGSVCVGVCVCVCGCVWVRGARVNGIHNMTIINYTHTVL